MKFLSPEVGQHLYQPTMQPCIEYCCHVWAGATSCFLELLDQLQKLIWRAVGSSLVLPPLNPWLIVEMQPVYVFSFRGQFGRCSSELAELVPLTYSRGRSTHHPDRLHNFSASIHRCQKDVYVNSFFPHTATLWNSLLTECFSLTYDLNGLKCSINRHLLTVGSF